MSANSNNSDSPSTLPVPELNPLLNPVLAANMGRWAEIYFTTPPEKRDEAVLELLRELREHGGSPSGASIPEAPTPQKLPKRPSVTAPEKKEIHSQKEIHSSEELPPEEAIHADTEWSVCESCGGRNILGNKFCGMCAAPLSRTHAASAAPAPGQTWGSVLERENDSELAETRRYEADLYGEFRESPQDHSPVEAEAWQVGAGRDRGREDRAGEDQGAEDQAWEDQAWREASGARFRRVEEPQARPNNWPARPDIPSLTLADTQGSGRRGWYTVLALVIASLIGGLIYMGSRSRGETSRLLPNPSPSLNAPPAAEVHSSSEEPIRPPRDIDASATSATERGPVATSSRPQHRTPPTTTSPPNAGMATQAAAEQTPTPIVATLQGNGSEELAVAEGYLKGSHGHARDAAEAAKWLWRSFGKKNSNAALLLSDLYLQGDGVPQSCDQARLLLDAAARNGAAAAAQKLRTLPSVGCQ